MTGKESKDDHGTEAVRLNTVKIDKITTTVKTTLNESTTSHTNIEVFLKAYDRSSKELQQDAKKLLKEVCH